MKINPVIILFTTLLLSIPYLGKAEEVVVTDADTVWTPDLNIESSEIVDSTDAPVQNLVKGVFISHAETILNLDLEEPKLSKPSLPTKWSFAIITDLHIGRGYLDYDGEGFGDGYNGEEYYLTQRLRNVVDWIIRNRNNVRCENVTCSIKFLVVLGDIADSAEKSEFLKAKEILDKLNDYHIPYVPVFGNHDVWPWTENDEANSPLGENYLDEIFWSENATNTRLMKEMLNWERDEIHKNYKNFAFNYGGINFIGLDFNSRKPFMKFGKGVGADAVLNDINKGWLEKKLEEFKGEPIILLTHHPLIFDPINAFSFTEFPQLENLLKDNITVFFDFAGHIHSFEEWHGKGWWVANANKKYTPIASTNVLTTEALMVGSNGRGIEKETGENGVVDGKKGIVRIVKIFNKEKIEPNNWETTETGDEFVGLNPNFDYYPVTAAGGGNPIGYQFIAKYFSERKIAEFKWDFGPPIGQKTGKEVFVPIESIQQGISSGVYEKNGDEVKIPVKLSLVDEKTGKDEDIPRKEKVYFAPAYLIIGPSVNQFTSLRNDQKLTVIPENRNGIEVLIDVNHSPSTPVGVITVNFGEAQNNINLRELIADSDIQKGKSILYMKNWPNEVKMSKVLFLPKK
jgi:predicted MPP superfamily phosphohydrolase